MANSDEVVTQSGDDTIENPVKLNGSIHVFQWQM